MPFENVSSVRHSPDSHKIAADLGLLAGLGGSWRGTGFNLIARPNFSGGTNLYLQLNQTQETLTIDEIGSPIPNRGFGQSDIELFGLTYLQKISDAFNGGALHIEPGIWITQPITTYPAVPPVPPLPPGAQIVARMGSIPHGNALLAQGIAAPFVGTPVLKPAGATNYGFSAFPSFNSTPFPLPPQPAPPAPPVLPSMNAAGSSELGTLPNPPRFDEYNLLLPESATLQRTPYGTNPPQPALPAAINGVAMQDVVNDPITLLEAVINEQVADGHTFSGTVLNISTQATIQFLTTANTPAGPTVEVTPLNGAGGIENILFLDGIAQPAGRGPNAQTATVYATFWIETVAHPTRPTFQQLQYAQMVVLDFPILLPPPPSIPPPPLPPNIGWPHISVATLRKSFS